MKNRLSFNQAAGKIRAMKDDLSSGKFKSDVLKQIKDEAKISIAPPNDRRAYLLNAIKGLEEASANGERVFLIITQEISSTYTRKQIGNILKQILQARIHGYTCGQIAHFFKIPTKAIEALEELAKLELETALKAKGFVEISGINDTP